MPDWRARESAALPEDSAATREEAAWIRKYLDLADSFLGRLTQEPRQTWRPQIKTIWRRTSTIILGDKGRGRAA